MAKVYVDLGDSALIYRNVSSGDSLTGIPAGAHEIDIVGGSNTFVQGDLASVVSNQSASVVDLDTISASFDTNGDDGDWFAVVSTNGTTPDDGQKVEDGFDNSGTNTNVEATATDPVSAAGTISLGNIDVTTGGEYYVHIVHKDGAGQYSNVVTTNRVLPGATIQPVQNLIVSESKSLSREPLIEPPTERLTLTWDEVAGADSYTIERGIGGGAVTTIATGVTEASYTDTNLVAGLTPVDGYGIATNPGNGQVAISVGNSGYAFSDHVYQVRAVVGSTTGPASNSVIAEALLEVATVYDYEVSDDGESAWSSLATDQGPGYIHTGATNGQQYHYRVRPKLGAVTALNWTPTGTISNRATPSVAEGNSMFPAVDASNFREMTAFANLAKIADADVVSVQSGDWSDPATWGGAVPTADQNVYIRMADDLVFDETQTPRLGWVRVDGALDWDGAGNRELRADAVYVSPMARYAMGDAAAPVPIGTVFQLTFNNRGNLDPVADPFLMGRGLVSAMAEIRMHGHIKTLKEKVATDPSAGDTTVTLASAPVDWEVGDLLVVAGSAGYAGLSTAHESEEVTITAISGATITFTPALVYDHPGRSSILNPGTNYRCDVVNHTRNVRIVSEDGASTPPSQRGHCMFMGGRNADRRYAAFHFLGRTNKQVDTREVSSLIEPSATANVRGRYPAHDHRMKGGFKDQDPSMWVGNSVFDTPGWGFVHHDSHAHFVRNAVHKFGGAGFVGENGNETGRWADNIATMGTPFENGPIRGINKSTKFDIGRAGEGYYMQGRMIHNVRNVAADCYNGFTFFHRGPVNSASNLLFVVEDQFEFGDGMERYFDVRPNLVPIIKFDEQEAYGSNQAIQVVKDNPRQGTEIRSFFDKVYAWNVSNGIIIEYSAHYTIKAAEMLESAKYPGSFGFAYGNRTWNNWLIESHIEGFAYSMYVDTPDVGITGIVHHAFDSTRANWREGQYFDANGGVAQFQDEPLSLLNEVETITVTLDEDPIVMDNDGQPNPIDFTGTKVDSLGSFSFPATSADDDGRSPWTYRDIVRDQGYRTDGGNQYFILPWYFTDTYKNKLTKLNNVVQVGTGFSATNEAGAFDAGPINLSNSGPTAVNKSASTTPNTSVDIDVLAGSSDPNGHTLVVDGVAPPTNGAAYDLGNGSIRYVPDPGFTGSDEFDYWIHDQHGGTVRASATVTISAAASYTQEVVDNQDAAYLVLAGGLTDAPQFTLSMWVDAQSLAGGERLWDDRNSRVEVETDGDIAIQIRDSSDTLIWRILTTSTPLSGSGLVHVYVAVDLATPSAEVRINGSVPSLTTFNAISTGTQAVWLSDDMGFLARASGGQRSDMHVADIFLDSTQIVPVADLYNGGTPPDLSSVGSPAVLVSGDATVWNAGTNSGSGANLTVTGTFVDV